MNKTHEYKILELLNKVSIKKNNIEFKNWLIAPKYVEMFGLKVNLVYKLKILFSYLIYFQPFKFKKKNKKRLNKLENLDFIFIFDKDLYDKRHSPDILDVILETIKCTKNILIVSSFDTTINYFKKLNIKTYKLLRPSIKDFIFVNNIRLEFKLIKYYQHFFHQAFYVDQILIDIENMRTKKIVFLQDFHLTDQTFYQIYHKFYPKTTTITLQHGMMMPFEDKLGIFYFIFSEYFCVWGQKEVDLYRTHGFNTKVLPIGSTKFRYNSVVSSNKLENILFLLPGSYEDGFLDELLIFFSKFKYKIVIKPHPANSRKLLHSIISRFSNIEVDIIDTLGNIKDINFAIGFNSSIALDIFAMEIPFVNYRNKTQPQKNHSDYTVLNIEKNRLCNIFDEVFNHRKEIVEFQNKKLKYEVFSNTPGKEFCEKFCINMDQGDYV